MGFIQTAAEGALDLSLDRVRRGADHGEFNPRPDFDPKQAAELQAEQRDGRTAEAYRPVLEHHGFVWREIAQLPALEGNEFRTDLVYRTEGEWRHRKLRLAFTPTDLTTGFPGGPPDLDQYLKDAVLAAKTRAGRVTQADLRKSRRR